MPDVLGPIPFIGVYPVPQVKVCLAAAAEGKPYSGALQHAPVIIRRPGGGTKDAPDATVRQLREDAVRYCLGPV